MSNTVCNHIELRHPDPQQLAAARGDVQRIPNLKEAPYVHQDAERLSVHADTAWQPPIAWAVALQARGFEVSLAYQIELSEGMGLLERGVHTPLPQDEVIQATQLAAPSPRAAAILQRLDNTPVGGTRLQPA